MNTQDVKIGTVYPYQKNAKKHPTKQVREIAASIKAFGFNQPIVVDKKNVIIVGHGRYEAAKLLKLQKVPVIHVALSKDDARAYRLADNKLNESDWDMKLVIAELKDLVREKIVLTGFNVDLTITPTEDEVPPVPKKAKAKLGDLYQLGEHRLLCGDATKREDVERLMAGKKADMVFTDPPYGVDYTGKTKDAMTMQNDKETEVFSRSIVLWPLRGGASVYVCCPAGSNFIQFEMPFQERCHHSATIIWAKNSMVLGHGDYHYQHEPILYGWEKSATHKYYGDRTQTTLWNIDRPSSSKEHPTMKPIKLVTRAILNSSQEGQLVFDPFGGSGTTLISAEQTNRKCYMLELDEKYISVILDRWTLLTHDKAYRINEDGTKTAWSDI